MKKRLHYAFRAELGTHQALPDITGFLSPQKTVSGVNPLCSFQKAPKILIQIRITEKLNT